MNDEYYFGNCLIWWNFIIDWAEEGIDNLE